MDGFKIVAVRVLVREHDDEEVRSGFMNLIEHDASLGGYISVDDLTEDDKHVWSEVIEDAVKEAAEL